MNTQTIKEGLFDPRHSGSHLYQPAQWLYREVCQIGAPFKGTSLTEQAGELVEKLARVALLALAPFVLILAGFGLVYNFCASIIYPLTDELFVKVHELDEACDHLFTDLRHTPPEYWDNVQQRCSSLGQELERVKEYSNFESLRARFEAIKAQLIYIRNNPIELYYIPPCINKDGRIPIPAQGNCFYEAVIRGLPLYNCQGNAEIDAAELREWVIKWERQNWASDEMLRSYIEVAISTYLKDMEQKIQDETASIEAIEADGIDQSQKRAELVELEKKLEPFRSPDLHTCISHYFTQASREGFWATTAEFYALSKMYNIKLIVRRRNDGKEDLVAKETFNEFASREMTIWYVDHHHFELCMEQA